MVNGINDDDRHVENKKAETRDTYMSLQRWWDHHKYTTDLQFLADC